MNTTLIARISQRYNWRCSRSPCQLLYVCCPPAFAAPAAAVLDDQLAACPRDVLPAASQCQPHHKVLQTGTFPSIRTVCLILVARWF